MFLLEALGQKAIEAGMPVAWFTLEQIGIVVRAHRADDSLGKAIAKIVRAELIIIDDVGLLPVGADAAEGLYRIVEAAYERKSVAVSSNLHPSGFDELMPSALATATVNRLLHHAHLCQTSGDSVRLTRPARQGGDGLDVIKPGGRYHTTGRFVSATSQILLTSSGQSRCPPAVNSQCSLTRAYPAYADGS